MEERVRVYLGRCVCRFFYLVSVFEICCFFISSLIFKGVESGV